MNYVESFDKEKLAYHFYSEYKKNTPTIVIIHGLGGDIRLLMDFAEALKEKSPHFNILMYYFRGHAFSTNKFPKDFVDPTAVHARDLHQLLIKLGIDQPILIGHSYGGVVMQEYLNLGYKPTPLKNFFVCTSLSIPGFKIFSRLAYKIMTNLSTGSASVFKEANYKKGQFSRGRDLDLRRYIFDINITHGPARWLLHLIAMSSWKNQTPTVIDQNNCYYIYGSADVIIPVPTQELQLRNLNKLAKITIDAGHIAPITASKKLAAIISEFL